MVWNGCLQSTRMEVEDPAMRESSWTDRLGLGSGLGIATVYGEAEEGRWWLTR